MREKGFSLIELMIVIGIIGLLASFAIPAYQSHLVKARITEGLALATAAQTLVIDNLYAGEEDLGATWESPLATTNVANISIRPQSGEIKITYTALAKNLHLSLKPLSNGKALKAQEMPNTAIVWTCAVNDAKKNSYVPANCRV